MLCRSARPNRSTSIPITVGFLGIAPLCRTGNRSRPTSPEVPATIFANNEEFRSPNAQLIASQSRCGTGAPSNGPALRSSNRPILSRYSHPLASTCTGCTMRMTPAVSGQGLPSNGHVWPQSEAQPTGAEAPLVLLRKVVVLARPYPCNGPLETVPSVHLRFHARPGFLTPSRTGSPGPPGMLVQRQRPRADPGAPERHCAARNCQ